MHEYEQIPEDKKDETPQEENVRPFFIKKYISIFKNFTNSKKWKSLRPVK